MYREHICTSKSKVDFLLCSPLLQTASPQENQLGPLERIHPASGRAVLKLLSLANFVTIAATEWSGTRDMNCGDTGLVTKDRMEVAKYFPLFSQAQRQAPGSWETSGSSSFRTISN